MKLKVLILLGLSCFIQLTLCVNKEKVKMGTLGQPGDQYYPINNPNPIPSSRGPKWVVGSISNVQPRQPLITTDVDEMRSDANKKLITLGYNKNYLNDPENYALVTSQYEDPVIVAAPADDHSRSEAKKGADALEAEKAVERMDSKQIHQLLNKHYPTIESFLIRVRPKLDLNDQEERLLLKIRQLVKLLHQRYGTIITDEEDTKRVDQIDLLLKKLLEANPNEHPVAASSGNSAASAVVDNAGRQPANVSESLSAKIANLKLSLQRTEDDIKVSKNATVAAAAAASNVSNASNSSNASNASNVSNSSKSRFNRLATEDDEGENTNEGKNDTNGTNKTNETNSTDDDSNDNNSTNNESNDSNATSKNESNESESESNQNQGSSSGEENNQSEGSEGSNNESNNSTDSNATDSDDNSTNSSNSTNDTNSSDSDDDDKKPKQNEDSKDSEDGDESKENKKKKNDESQEEEEEDKKKKQKDDGDNEEEDEEEKKKKEAAEKEKKKKEKKKNQKKGSSESYLRRR